MDKAAYEIADPIVDEIAEVANGLLESAERAKLGSALVVPAQAMDHIRDR